MQKKSLFSQEEYRHRLGKVKERMDHDGIQVLLIIDPANMNYLTGYDGWSFYVHQGVVVDLEEENPLWFGRQQDANGLEFIKPGITAEQVEERWRMAIAHTGVVKPSRVGYSFGLNYVPDWGEHTVSLRPGDKTILEPGMTLHFMPGIWLDTYGF
jgi:Xaa-Pro aminopeptidase